MEKAQRKWRVVLHVDLDAYYALDDRYRTPDERET